MIDFVYNSTMYSSLVQAYEVERLTQLGRRKDLGAILLKSRSPAGIRKIALGVTGDIENPRGLWIEILKSVVAQHPRYADILRSTGKATLVYTDPKEKTIPKLRRWGVGLTIEDPDTAKKEAWDGPNTLGQAWGVVRDNLESVEAEAAAAAAKEPEQKGGFTETSHTNAEAKKQRAGVLMNYYRKRSA
jgi:hypothetical protein